MKARVLLAAIVVAAGLIPTVSSGPAYADGPEGGGSEGTFITVTPDDGLPATQSVTVSGTGYFPNQTGGLIDECGIQPGLDLEDCVPIGLFSTDASGNFGPIPVTVNRTFNVTGGNAPIDCTVTTCSVSATAGAKNAFHHLTFGGGGGGPADRPVADFDGDNDTDVSVFRPSSSTWFLRTATPQSIPWGASGDVPVPGDYDGDGNADLAVFRPSSGVWFLRTPTPQSIPWGVSGDIPVPGDYDGNGTTDLAVFRPSSNVWFLRTTTPSSPTWGASGDIPAPGDYDGNGSTDVAVFRPSTGTWFLRTPTPQTILWGTDGDIPVPGDYDGNGGTDIAVWRPTNGVWYLNTTAPLSPKWGVAGDVPLALPHAIMRTVLPALFGSTTPLASGRDHSLSVRSDGTVIAWGVNSSGQLGDGTTTDRGDPVRVSGLIGVVSVAAGIGHSLALKSDGTVLAWGSNQNGELGDADAGLDKPLPVQVLALEGMSGIAAGCDHSLAVGTDGSVRAWGRNNVGQVGIDPAIFPHSQVWAQVEGVSGVVSVAAGCGFSVALDVNGTVWAWGDNTYGQLGSNSPARYTPAPVPGLPPIAAIAAGARHVLALASEGTVRSWGDDSSGQLGQGGPGASLVDASAAPGAVVNLINVRGIGAGVAHSTAVTASGSVWAWGANDQNQLGNNSLVARSSPVQVYRDTSGNFLTGMSSTIASGGDHTVVVSNQLDLFEFGFLRGPPPGQRRPVGTIRIVAAALALAVLVAPAAISRRTPSQPKCKNQNITLGPDYLPRDAKGRPQKGHRLLNWASVRIERRTIPDFDPIGLNSGELALPDDRSHLIASQFGGAASTNDPRGRLNIVAAYKHVNQYPEGMAKYENELFVRLGTDCETVDYTVTTSYDGDSCAPIRYENGVPVEGDGPDCRPATITMYAETLAVPPVVILDRPFPNK